jgi:hypothetical protein
MFKITKNNFRKRNLIVSLCVLLWLSLASIQIICNYFNSILLGIIIILIIITIGLTVNIIKNYEVIGEFTICDKFIEIIIGDRKDIIEIEPEKYNYIKFSYKGFKGDQPVHALFGLGTLYFYNGASNTFEISSYDKIFKFDILINSNQDLKFLKRILIKINEVGQNVLIMNK